MATANTPADGPIVGKAEERTEQLELLGTVEVDETGDSAVGDDDFQSDTTSLASSLIKGRMENGRRYATLRDDYWGPSDEKQFEAMDDTHLAWLILLNDQSNTLFRAPVKDPKRILDIGTGPGLWAIDVADEFPDAKVYGVDMFPPSTTWVPMNCHLEVEDVTRQWTWRERFDFIHVRYLIGSFTQQEWADLYEQVYDSLEPGGWFEQCEPDCRIMADDGSLPSDAYLQEWANTLFGCAEKMGRSLKTIDEMRAEIEKAGFTNMQEEYIKIPFGPWPKNQKLKEAGSVYQRMFLNGLDGYAMHFLTNYGSPVPWSKEEVLVYTAKIRNEVKNPKYHIYHFNRRV